MQMKLPKKTIKVMLLVMPDALMPGSTKTNSNMVIKVTIHYDQTTSVWSQVLLV